MLYTDASTHSIGACLTQVFEKSGQKVERPIYYLSPKLSDTQSRWSTIERECYSIFYSLTKLDHYLHNVEFTIKCDHKPLKYLLESPMQNKKVSLWALTISSCRCKIEFLKGSENSVADLLSRVDDNRSQNNDPLLDELDISNKTYEIGALNSNRFNPKEFARCKATFPDKVVKPSYRSGLNMVEEQEKDDVILKLRQDLKKEKLSPAVSRKYILLDNILYFISKVDTDPILRLCIPKQL